MPSDKRYEKIYTDSYGNRVPPNTYLRSSKHGLTYYVSFSVAGKQHVHNLHIIDGEPDAYMKAWNLSRRYILVAKAHQLEQAMRETASPAPSVQPAPPHTAPIAQSVLEELAPVVPAKRFLRTLHYILNDFITVREAKGVHSPSDYPATRSRVANLLRIFGERTLIERLTSEHMERYIHTRRKETAKHTAYLITDKTIRRELQVLNRAVRHAIVRGWLPSTYVLPPHDVTWNRSIAREARRAKGRNEQTIEAIRTHPDMPTWLRLRIDVVLATGLRKHELESMRPSWIAEAQEPRAPRIYVPAVLHVPGSAPDFYRAISRACYEELQAHIDRHPGMRENDDPLFPPQPQSDRYLSKVSEQVGVPKITWRDLRSTHGKRIYSAHGIKGAQRALGHATQTMTENYLRADEDEMDALAWNLPERAQK